jgi:hypothetical protein
MDRLKKQVGKLTDNFEVVKSDMDNVGFPREVQSANERFDLNIKK